MYQHVRCCAASQLATRTASHTACQACIVRLRVCMCAHLLSPHGNTGLGIYDPVRMRCCAGSSVIGRQGGCRHGRARAGGSDPHAGGSLHMAAARQEHSFRIPHDRPVAPLEALPLRCLPLANTAGAFTPPACAHQLISPRPTHVEILRLSKSLLPFLFRTENLK